MVQQQPDHIQVTAVSCSMERRGAAWGLRRRTSTALKKKRAHSEVTAATGIVLRGDRGVRYMRTSCSEVSTAPNTHSPELCIQPSLAGSGLCPSGPKRRPAPGPRPSQQTRYLQKRMMCRSVGTFHEGWNMKQFDFGGALLTGNTYIFSYYIIMNANLVQNPFQSASGKHWERRPDVSSTHTGVCQPPFCSFTRTGRSLTRT